MRLEDLYSGEGLTVRLKDRPSGDDADNGMPR